MLVKESGACFRSMVKSRTEAKVQQPSCTSIWPPQTCDDACTETCHSIPHDVESHVGMTAEFFNAQLREPLGGIVILFFLPFFARFFRQNQHLSTYTGTSKNKHLNDQNQHLSA